MHSTPTTKSMDLQASRWTTMPPSDIACQEARRRKDKERDALPSSDPICAHAQSFTIQFVRCTPFSYICRPAHRSPTASSWFHCNRPRVTQCPLTAPPRSIQTLHKPASILSPSILIFNLNLQLRLQHLRHLVCLPTFFLCDIFCSTGQTPPLAFLTASVQGAVCQERRLGLS